MNLEAFVQQAFNLAGTFNPALVVFLFLICFIGEFTVGIPYLLETIWLFSGYNFGNGAIPAIDLFLLLLVALAGREAGAITIAYLSRYGSGPIVKFYNKHFQARVAQKMAENNSSKVSFFRKINFTSPFSVAMGRLLWLRIPLSLVLGAKRQIKALALGVLMASLVWDGIYIVLGVVVGANATIKPEQMLVYSLIGLTLMYAGTFAARHLWKLRTSRKHVREQA